MEKFRGYIEKWISGEKVRSIEVSLEDIYSCIEVYNGITREEKPEFINGKVKEILDECNIRTVEYGIGWKVA